jgi:hypothetical protein
MALAISNTSNPWDSFGQSEPYEGEIIFSSVGEDVGILSGINLLDVEEMRRRYLGLGPNKWVECIDASDRALGKYAYDLGLHKGPREPGYIESMENVFSFLQGNLTELLTPDLYLKIHKIACAHFNAREASKFTGCASDKVGKFRDRGDYISWYTKKPMKEAALNEFTYLDLGFYDPLHRVIYYKEFSSSEVRKKLSGFIEDYYKGIRMAQNDAKKKLRVIASLFQQMEWLHPPVDGCSRTDLAILNFLLVQNGFHPVLLDHPFRSSTIGLEEWVSHLETGLACFQETMHWLEAELVIG